MLWISRFVSVGLAGLLFGSAFSPAAHAAVFHVTKTADTLDGACDSDCSLREAVVAANASSGAVIELGAGVYLLTRAGAGEGVAATGDLDLQSDLTLQGAGAASTVIDGGGLDRILEIAGPGSVGGWDIRPRVEIADLTLRGGHAGVGGSFDAGGAIHNSGWLTVTRSVITGNRADGNGGGIFDELSVTLRDSTIAGNTSGLNGGGLASIFGVMSLTNVTFSGNQAHTNGGALVAAGGFRSQGRLRNVTITNNHTDQGPAVSIEGSQDPLYPVIEHTIIAGNTSDFAHECGPVEVTAEHNVIVSDFLAGPCQQPNPFNNQLAPLGNYGGPTPTHALLPGSVVIDAGGSAAGADPGDCEPTDQRGFPRPRDGNNDGTVRCDPGAFELGQSIVEVPALSGPGLLALIAALGLLGMAVLRRRSV